MQYAYGAELKRRLRSDEADTTNTMVMDYLLECAPLLANYEKWKERVASSQTVAHFNGSVYPAHIREDEVFGRDRRTRKAPQYGNLSCVRHGVCERPL